AFHQFTRDTGAISDASDSVVACAWIGLLAFAALDQDGARRDARRSDHLRIEGSGEPSRRCADVGVRVDGALRLARRRASFMSTLFTALLSIVLSVAAQFMLKVGMRAATSELGPSEALGLRSVGTVLLNPFVLGGFALYGFGAIAWLGVLAKWDV